jgi:predicted nucleotidyltransferase
MQGFENSNVSVKKADSPLASLACPPDVRSGGTLREHLERLRKNMRDEREKYGIIHIGRFSFVARGEQHAGSEVDVCAKMEKPNLFLRIGLKDDLQRVFNCAVDGVRLRQNMHPFLRDSIGKEAVYA